jgi:hypothetical protein
MINHSKSRKVCALRLSYTRGKVPARLKVAVKTVNRYDDSEFPLARIQ